MQVKLSTMICLFYLIGCLYQIYDATKSYIQFKVRHDVAYDYSTFIELPAIDIMVPMVMALNYTILSADREKLQDYCGKLKVKYDSLYKVNTTTDNLNDVVRKCATYHHFLYTDYFPFFESEDFPFKMNVKNIKENTDDLSLLVSELSVASFGLLTDSNCKLTRYYNAVAIFMRLFCLNGTRPLSINTNFVSVNEGVLSKFRYRPGYYFGIRFSDPADLPDYDPSKYFMFEGKPGSFPCVLLSFRKTVISSLEFPYETNCRHYNKRKNISKCMTEYTLGQSPPYLDKYSVYEWDEHPSYLGFNGDNEGDRRNGGKKVSQGTELDAFINCNQQAAAIECEKTSYVVGGRILDKIGQGFVIIEPSWRVNKYLSVHPVLPWGEYVIHIARIVGFWLGISMYGVIENGLRVFVF